MQLLFGDTAKWCEGSNVSPAYSLEETKDKLFEYFANGILTAEGFMERLLDNRMHMDRDGDRYLLEWLNRLEFAWISEEYYEVARALRTCHSDIKVIAKQLNYSTNAIYEIRDGSSTRTDEKLKEIASKRMAHFEELKKEDEKSLVELRKLSEILEDKIWEEMRAQLYSPFARALGMYEKLREKESGKMDTREVAALDEANRQLKRLRKSKEEDEQ